MYKVIYPHQFADGPSVRTVTRDFTKIASHVPPEMIDAIASLEKKAGKKMTYVPYKGGGEVAVQLVGKHVDSSVNNPIEEVAHWRSGAQCGFTSKSIPACIASASSRATWPRSAT